ncbi:MAG: sigma 54-interacting transcriptional regulator, partial [Lawsonibacter sp.]
MAKDGTLRCSATIYPLMDMDTPVLNVTLKPQHHLIASVNKLSGNRAVYTFDDIFTEDPGMKRILTLAQTYARYDGNILIEGESGTGKELLAQAIHNANSRASGPFVVVNCASIPRETLASDLFGYEVGAFSEASCEGSPGQFELANHGTLFLDEIAEIPLDFQSKLLRAVESHSITRVGGKEEIKLDIRIITSTNHNLEMDVANQSFSPELFFRLNILRLNVPPLRERIHDAVYCANCFLERLNARYPSMSRTCSPEFLSGLLRYHWPGNVRELQNSIERAFYSSTDQVLGEESLSFVYPLTLDQNRSPLPGRDMDESGRIRSALAICGGDVEAAAV